ncbi:MAG: hypothetical protein AB7O57_05490 [Hyphomicrobiaceae bacterium]
MRSTFVIGALVALLSGALAGAAHAQATRPAPGAGLARIDDGVFELRQGSSVDLTRHAILLTVKAEQSPRSIERGQFSVLVAGQQVVTEPGRRIDLKRQRGLDRQLKELDHCILDVVGFVAPKGAPATATFRLSCI